MKEEVVTIAEIKRFGLQITQPADGYHFSLDSLLLANFVNPTAGMHFCDLGTGSGIISLILCKRFPSASVLAIDSNEEMVKLAIENAACNDLSDRIKPVKVDVIDLKRLFPVSSFDGVVANPPFRTSSSGKVSPKAGRDTARHETTAGIADFLSAAKYLVKPSGKICFVYHPDRLVDFIRCATELKLSLLRLRMVHGTPDAPAKIFLAEVAKGRRGTASILPPLIVYEANGAYTSDMQSIFQGIIHGEGSNYVQ